MATATKKPQKYTTLNVLPRERDEAKKIAKRHRLQMTQLPAVLMAGWSKLSPTLRDECIEQVINK